MSGDGIRWNAGERERERRKRRKPPTGAVERARKEGHGQIPG